MKNILLCLSLMLVAAPLAHAQAQARPVLKLTSNHALTEPLATGGQTITVTDDGTLSFEDGFTLAGASVFRTAAGLGSVENTALSTWAGSGNVTTLGTITSGTWNASAVGVAYGGTGATTVAAARVALLPSLSGNAGKVLAVNGGETDLEWITGGGGGLTIGTTTITSGTSGRVLYNNGGVVGELATTGSGNVVLAASPTITGTATIGTVYGQGVDQLGDGILLVHPSLPLNSPGAGFQIWNNWCLHWRTTNSVGLWGDVADVLWLRNSTRAQGVTIANTYTSPTNYEALSISWTGNVARIQPTAGSGGGTVQRAEYFTTGSVFWSSGSGSPEGVVTAPVGSLYTRTDGGSGTTLYVKESGTGDTGWTAK